MVEHVESQLALALTFGVFMQILAHHLRLPGIILLLVGGVLCGPQGFNLLKPEIINGPLLHGVISFAVAVILFEGGLALDFKRLKGESKTIRNLVSIGAFVQV